jgi:hypothetical protein
VERDNLSRNLNNNNLELFKIKQNSEKTINENMMLKQRFSDLEYEFLGFKNIMSKEAHNLKFDLDKVTKERNSILIELEKLKDLLRNIKLL